MAKDRREDAGEFYPGGSVIPRGPVTRGGGTPADYTAVRKNAATGAAHAADPDPHVSTKDRALWNGKQDELSDTQLANIDDVPNRRDKTDMFTDWVFSGEDLSKYDTPLRCDEAVVTEGLSHYWLYDATGNYIGEAYGDNGLLTISKFGNVKVTATRQRILTTDYVTTDLMNPPEGKAADASAVAKELAKKRSLDDFRVPKTEPMNEHWVWSPPDEDGGFSRRLTTYGAPKPIFDVPSGVWKLTDEFEGYKAVSRESDQTLTSVIFQFSKQGADTIVTLAMRASATDTTPVPCHPRADGSIVFDDSDGLAKKSDIAAATKLTPVTVEGKTTAYTLGTDTVKKLMAGTTADLSGITAQDIEDFKKYRGEGRATHYKVGDIAYTEGGTPESNSYYCRAEYDETDGKNVGNPYYWGPEFFPTDGFKKLIYLFGSDNKHLGQTITELAEAACADNPSASVASLEGRVVPCVSGASGTVDVSFAARKDGDTTLRFFDVLIKDVPSGGCQINLPPTESFIYGNALKAEEGWNHYSFAEFKDGATYKWAVNRVKMSTSQS